MSKLPFYLFVDTHRFGIHQIDVHFKYGPHCAYGGDNFDVRGCKKRLIGYCLVARDKHIDKCDKTDTPVVSGNHSGTIKRMLVIFEFNGKRICLIHGDYGIFWTEERSIAFRHKPHGKSFWKRWLSLSYSWIRRHKKWKSEDLMKASAFARRQNCDIIMLGHRHPKHVLDETYNGVRCIIGARGENKLWI